MSTTLSICVADDEADMREFFQVVLESHGHRVFVAESGTELIALCTEHEPDLVITDIRMSDVDGLEAARVIYEERAVPIVVVTAQPFDAWELERLQAEVSAILRKEADLEQALKDTVREVLAAQENGARAAGASSLRPE